MSSSPTALANATKVYSYVYVLCSLQAILLFQIAEQLIDVINDEYYTFPLPNSNLLITASSATLMGLSREPNGNVVCRLLWMYVIGPVKMNQVGTNATI